MSAGLSAQQLAEIDARAAHLYEYVEQPDDADVLAGEDVPALLAEVKRLAERIANLEQQAVKVAEVRAAALAVLRRPNRLTPEVMITTPVHWRVIIGDSESMDSIAPVCPAITDTNGLHVIADYPGGPIQDETGVYDCCPTPWIEVGRGEIAAYLVALLNADAEAGESR